MDVVVHAEMIFNSPWQVGAHSLRDISLHYPSIRLFASMLVDDGSCWYLYRRDMTLKLRMIDSAMGCSIIERRCRQYPNAGENTSHTP
jgi:hypothetical protein